jgi:hypothetical protein
MMLGIYEAHMATINLLFDQLWDRQMGDSMMEVITKSNLHCQDRSQTTEGSVIIILSIAFDCTIMMLVCWMDMNGWHRLL